jgi:hypothetical protein
MIAYVIDGGKYERTSHPKWKYWLAKDLVVWMSHKVKKPIEFRAKSGYLIARWDGHILTIFRGYVMDGATLWPDHKKGMHGFAVHDFGYQIGQILSREQWDQVMLSIHKHDGYLARHIVYAGVRAGGWNFFGKSEPVHITEV